MWMGYRATHALKSLEHATAAVEFIAKGDFK